ncbi:hypothetical protein CBR_g63 [Chara braunii]|uniref:RNA-directed DNA polymerase n=1 Tax=Chara braunii TaxID=69332 RepID=A0A388JLS1_CHABU|nr:hypothetical protein CBR_g63 [Chara braunii]|eukprot:GBG58662.1 hypothetical protein CBR_g63 [Chara braunii]
MAGSQFSSPPPRTWEQMELQQVERIRLSLEEELKQATKREKKIRDRSVRLEGREADKAALEGSDDSAFSNTEKIFKASILSMHAYMDSKLYTIQDTLDQTLNVMHRPGIRPEVLPSLPFSAMTGPYVAQSGPSPSGTSAAAMSQTVASSSSGPAAGATPPPPTVSPVGQQQPWYPKTPLKPPPTFSGDKKDEGLDTWLGTVPVWVKAKRTLVEEEVITAASYLEGSATRWLNGLVASKGFGRKMGDCVKTYTLENFMALVEARWHNPQQPQIATDGLLKLDSRKCLPTDIKNLLASEACLEYHTFETFNKKALDLEATLGGAQTPTTDGRKKKSPQEWKKKGSQLMMVDSDGNQTEIDDVSELVEGSELNGEESAEGSNLAAVVKTKAGGRGKGGQQRSQGQAANPNKIAAWVRVGLDQAGDVPSPFQELAKAIDSLVTPRTHPDLQVLAQQEGEKLTSVEYMSKKMPSNKLAKSTYERELYALYKALIHWRHYLLGRFFYFRTNHQTLKWIKTQPVLSDARKRWIEVIDQYDFKLDYVKGEYNKVADALSRSANYLGALISEFGLSKDVTRSLGEAYKEDPATMDIINKLQAKDKATSDEFVMVDGLLFLEKAGFKRPSTVVSGLGAGSEAQPEATGSVQPGHTQHPGGCHFNKGSEAAQARHSGQCRQCGSAAALSLDAELLPRALTGRVVKSGETDEAYQARMLLLITEAEQRSDAVAAATKKKAEDAEKARLLAIEQQRQQDEAAAKAADEKQLQRRDKIFNGERALLTMAADWRVEAENGKPEESGNKIALLLSHLTDLLATCIAQQEDIHNLDDAVQTQNQVFDQLTSRLQQLEQTVAAPVANSSNTSDRLEALEIDVGSLKDGVKLQQNAMQLLEQRICTAATYSRSEPRETTPKLDDQEIFCDSMKTDPIPWFLDSPPLLYSFEDYAARLVAALGTHAQGQDVCATSSLSGNDNLSSSSGSSWDSAHEFNIEVLDSLTSEDFAWLPLPTTGRLSGRQCAALCAHLHMYLSFYGPPTSSTDDEVVVGDILAYVTKVAREFHNQRYDDNNAPLLYVCIQVGQASCSALLDSGVSRNFMSQAFMQKAGLGAQVRRKANPAVIKLADGRTQQLIDRYIESVPVYFAPHACEPVTFDILGTDFDIILEMPWLASADHTVNFHRRTLTVRNAFGAELLDDFADIFESPTGVVPDRPISHEIILEAGAVPPKGCIYRMSEEELTVIRAQLDDLLDKGWIRPSSSPYGAPVLFVREKNKDLRLCINYRKLYAQTVKNAGPLPRIVDLLERLGGAKYFSKLDLKLGYHQISIRPNDRHKSAFKTWYGHFEWVVMPLASPTPRRPFKQQ